VPTVITSTCIPTVTLALTPPPHKHRPSHHIHFLFIRRLLLYCYNTMSHLHEFRYVRHPPCRRLPIRKREPPNRTGVDLIKYSMLLNSFIVFQSFTICTPQRLSKFRVLSSKSILNCWQNGTTFTPHLVRHYYGCVTACLLQCSFCYSFPLIQCMHL